MHAGLLVLALAAAAGTAGADPADSTPIAAPLDRPYPGLIELHVDATDLDRRIVRVHEHLSGVAPGTVLFYPKWIPGHHAPNGPIQWLAGLTITANGAPVGWTRDPLDVYAFHLAAAPGASAIDIDFQFLSPTSAKVGSTEITRDLLSLVWNQYLLYPAGYYVSQIPVDAAVKLPAEWVYATALETADQRGAEIAFRRVSLETLVDSPLYAGAHTSKLDLDPGAKAPVHLDLFADRAAFLSVRPAALAAYRSLVQQTYKLFGARHFPHYDFLYSLSDELPHRGTEHFASSENGGVTNAFTDWERTASERMLLPHEFVHSWNGKFRRPDDLWTPNFNLPMQGSLLWVYEGQTDYWGGVLAARAELRTHDQALEDLALAAAFEQNQGGRQWRSLEDTNVDMIVHMRRPQPWPDWQRHEDYYTEGRLIWLDVDTLIRERSKGRRSLDDFARGFFGIDDGSMNTLTYRFEDIVAALNAVEVYDWASFLRERVDGTGRPAPLDGITRGGYRLVYTEAPGDYQRLRDALSRTVNLQFSIGLILDSWDGAIAQVEWQSPAFSAGLAEGMQILAVNGYAYGADVLKEAIQAAKNTTAPLELIVKSGDRFLVVHLDYHQGLRYPHLQRDAGKAALLDEILAPRK